MAAQQQGNRRQTKIISSVMEVRTLAMGIGSIGFEGIALSSVLSFAAAASPHERKLIAKVLKDGGQCHE